MTWWVLTASTPVVTYNAVIHRAFTNNADHLYMAWAYWKPARQPIYRVVRGTSVLCGYKYIWDTPTITEQDQPDDTLYHTFRLSNLTHRATIWWYLFAPDGPYGHEIQGPLRSVTLPDPPYWLKNLWVATKLKGVFTTRSMSGPGTDQPTWIPVNRELHSLSCWQYAPDRLDPAGRHFLITGAQGSRILYRLEPRHIYSWEFFWPSRFPDWEPLLTNADCLALTGWAAGEMAWVTTSAHLPGHVFLLFHHPASYDGAACIRSTDYGLTWESFPISPGPVHQRAGNIVCAILRGDSPYTASNVLYAAINNGLMGSFKVYISTDIGETWALGGSTQTSVAVPVVTVEPSDLSIVYLGAHVNIPNPNELFRSEDHGDAFAEIDGLHHLGHFLNAYWGQMWLESADIHRMRVLVQNTLWHSSNYAADWTTPGRAPVDVARLAIQDHSPDYLYLGRRTNTPPEGWPGYPHVFFVSDNETATMWGKCGDHAHLADGGGDSIPGDCGGLAYDGILHPYPS